MRGATFISSALCVLLVAAGAVSRTPLPAAPPAGDLPLEGGKFPGVDQPGPDASGAAVIGSLAIRGVQGTPGGGAIRNVHVEVDLVHRGMTVRTLAGELDDYGVIVFDDIALSPAVQPVTRIDYSGVVYQQVGDTMDRTAPQQMLDVVCYEVTNATPDWRTKMWHVMLSHDSGGIRVTEVAVIENPATETWIGTSRGSGRPVTVAFPVPENARDIKLGKGFHGWCCTTALPGEIVNHLPLMPRTTELTFSYSVPAQSGRATFDVIAPSDVDHMMLILPDDVTMQPVESLVLGGTDVISDTRVRYYMGADVHRGDRARLVLTGLSSPATPGMAGTGIDSGMVAKIVGGIGAGVILLVAVIFIFTRSSKPRPAGGATT